MELAVKLEVWQRRNSGGFWKWEWGDWRFLLLSPLPALPQDLAWLRGVLETAPPSFVDNPVRITHRPAAAHSGAAL